MENIDKIKEEKQLEIEQAIENGEVVTGILEVLEDGFGFIRSDNYLSSSEDVYVSASQIRRFHLKTGDFVTGFTRKPKANEKFKGLMFVTQINGYDPDKVKYRTQFEDLTPIYPNQKLHLGNENTSLRMIDLLSPIGKGQRGLIVSPPKAGKTSLLKNLALSIKRNNQDVHLIILLIDERPEEVTDIKEATMQDHVEVIYSTFDELPEKHKKVSEMTIERAKRLVECGENVIILLDSLTRLARAYNLICTPSGRTLSGGLDPASLYMPKRFFGAARNTKESGSLTILATALTETGSKMDDVIFEEFKGTGNMEIVLSRQLQEKRIFPAIDLLKSGTRKDDLLLTPTQMEAVNRIRRSFNSSRNDQAIESLITLFKKTDTNDDVIDLLLARK